MLSSRFRDDSLFVTDNAVAVLSKLLSKIWSTSSL